MSRFASAPVRLRTGLLLTVCALALTGCLEDLRERAEAKNVLEKSKQEELHVPQPAKPSIQAYDGLSKTYAVTGLAAESADEPIYQQQENTEHYLDFDDNPVKLTLEDPVSTFSVDVDTVSYSNVRRILMAGAQPPKKRVVLSGSTRMPSGSPAHRLGVTDFEVMERCKEWKKPPCTSWPGSSVWR